MLFFDLIIIYLTIGAPVSVYYFYRKGTPTNFREWALLVAAFGFWPPFAYQIVRARNENTRIEPRIVGIVGLDADTLDRVDKIISELGSGLGSNHHIKSDAVIKALCSYRDTRVALLFEPATPPGLQRLLDISGNEFPDIAVACRARRNLRKLEHHHRRIERAILEQIQMRDQQDRTVVESAMKMISGLLPLPSYQDLIEPDLGQKTLPQGSLEEWENQPMTIG
jgi:hypothetical protein